MGWLILSNLKTVKIGPALWMLLEPMYYQTSLGPFTVPAGFITDHASVPRLFTPIVPPVKSAVAEASVLHDWLYNKESHDVPRDFADLCLRQLIIANGGSKSLAYKTWLGVRMGGSFCFKKASYKDKEFYKEAYPVYRDLPYNELMKTLLI